MKNLQSKDLPFRTQQQYYKPQFNYKTIQSIKILPNSHPANKESILTPTSTLPSISISYLSGLNQAKQLPRRVPNHHQFYSVPKECKRHEHRTHNSIHQTPQEEDREHRQTKRVDTFLSNNTTNRSMLDILTHRTIQQKKLQEERTQFDFYKTNRNGQHQREMRFSFYNTIQKSQYFLKKFKQDSTLQQRRTNKYQNILRRNIKASEILDLLNKSKEKLRTGF